jgi:hypothetical protein
MTFPSSLARDALGACLLATAAATPAYAQQQLPPDEVLPKDTPPAALPAEADNVVAQGSGRTFLPDFFERFAPRNALDMVEQIPGFQLQDAGGGRGLGQAEGNVLVNGERLSSKSEGIRDQLSRIPAGNVVRIEVVDGVVLDLPGLTGQVANVITVSGGLAGQFAWRAELRTTAVDPEWYGGEISITGALGRLDYTLAVENPNSRFGSTGPTVFRDADGFIIEEQQTVFTGAFDVPRVATTLRYDFDDRVNATFNASYERSYSDRLEDEVRFFPDRLPISRTIARDGGAPEYEISGDLAFPLGPGRMKLIALEAWDGDDTTNVLIDTPSDGGVPTGSRFATIGGEGERIGRFEYGWRLWRAEWQLAGEAAFNRLDQAARLFALRPDGEFVEVDFPEGSGGVREARYEAILAVSRPLTPTIALQASAGAELSRIRLTGPIANERTFRRPKGAVSVAWQPSPGVDLSVELERRVGQLDFEDFLGTVFLDEDNENVGNNELVPAQDWQLTFEGNVGLGAWGSTSLILEQRWIEDLVDLIVLEDGGEARGNIDKARRTEIEWATTIRLDPAGWRGAQLDVRLEYEEGEVLDPVTSRLRDFSGGIDREVELDFRHDVPATDWAYGASFQYLRFRPSFRLSEIARGIDGPSFLDLFVEHKDVAGLTVNLTLANLNGGRDRFFRTVFDGPRSDGIVIFTEDRSLRIGPIFRLSVSGNF